MLNVPLMTGGSQTVNIISETEKKFEKSIRPKRYFL